MDDMEDLHLIVSTCFFSSSSLGMFLVDTSPPRGVSVQTRASVSEAQLSWKSLVQ